MSVYLCDEVKGCCVMTPDFMSVSLRGKSSTKQEDVWSKLSGWRQVWSSVVHVPFVFLELLNHFEVRRSRDSLLAAGVRHG